MHHNNNTVLIIDDERELAEMLQKELELAGFKVMIALGGNQALVQAKKFLPSIIILDVGLPDINGHELCRLLKQQEETRKVPIIFLTGKTSETDIIIGLGIGADDYICKPFNSKEVVARVQTVLRRTLEDKLWPTTRIEVGPLTLDSSRFEVKVGDVVVPFTTSEFKILWALTGAPGRVFTRDHLLDKVTPGEAAVVDRVIDVHVGMIRKKLGIHNSLIVTVRGVGYKCKEV